MLRLVVQAGVDEGEVFISHEPPVGIGTAPDNEVKLADTFVSRHHGQLSFADGAWFYRDLGSSNGSAIEREGIRIEAQRKGPAVQFQPGDLLVLGETVLRFDVAEVTETEQPRTVLASRSLDDFSASRQTQLGSIPNLLAAYQLERAIGLSFDPESTLDNILGAMLDAFSGATHVVLLLLDKKTGKPKRQIARARGETGRIKEELPISISVTNRVLGEGKSLLFRDVAAEFSDSRSVAAAGITSAICAPLWTGEETVGLIQVESRKARAGFSETDLEQLSLFANRAALAIVGSELREVEHRNQLLQDLSAMITHDLKGPLTGIMGFLQLLEGETLTEIQKEFVETALASSRWLAVLISGILDVAKLESGEVDLHIESVEVKNELEQAVKLIEYEFKEKGIKAVIDTPPDLPPAQVDRELFRRIVVNLAGNAVKFAPDNSTLTISAKLLPDADKLMVSVQDQGPGIAPEHQARIFEKFVQVEGGRQRKKVSVGLGLAFCKLAVEAHGGEIWVESEPEHGARFSFTAPIT